MVKENICILAIESSCDDTACAVLIGEEMAANFIATQELHKNYGGVVPEIASRAHQENIIPVVETAVRKAGIQLSDIDAIAFTRGPGLLGSLLVGVTFAKSLALALGKPLIEVNHMQAHIAAHYIDNPRPNFPFLCLTVSGGHTQLVSVTDFLEMEIIGETLDDAAGEAFDKAGKMLGLPYPAGPHIDRLARQGKPIYTFPEPQVGPFEFSFSGLKTAIKYFLRDHTSQFIHANLVDICASIQKSIVDILIKKLFAAAEKYAIREVAIAGGVSANSELRESFSKKAESLGYQYFIPKFEYCTDNAAMIAKAAFYKYQISAFADQSISPDPRLKF